MSDAQNQRPPARQPKASWTRAVVGFAIAVLAAGLAWQERDRILDHIGSWWVVSDELTQADAIVVLGGSIDVRPFAAAELYKRGLADKILIANVALRRAERLGFVPSHTELNRDVLLKLGVPAAAIVTFGEHVSSTREEAEGVRQWAAENHANLIIVPTELFTSRRTRWIFDRELAATDVHVMVQAFSPPNYGISDWWRRRDGLIDFNNEVLKYLYYRVRY
jgi:uncharacterized SAM-binding protein YcdF (DUF218 family)